MLRSTRDMLKKCGCPLARLRWSTSMEKGAFSPPRLYRTCKEPEEQRFVSWTEFFLTFYQNIRMWFICTHILTIFAKLSHYLPFKSIQNELSTWGKKIVCFWSDGASRDEEEWGKRWRIQKSHCLTGDYRYLLSQGSESAAKNLRELSLAAWELLYLNDRAHQRLKH